MMIDHDEDHRERGRARNLLDQDHDEDDDNEFDIYGDNDYNDNEFEKETSQAAPEGTYTGAVDVLKKLLKSEGPVALYKGCVPILLRCDNDHDNDDDAHLSPLLQLLDDGDPPLLLVPLLGLQVLQQGS